MCVNRSKRAPLAGERVRYCVARKWGANRFVPVAAPFPDEAFKLGNWCRATNPRLFGFHVFLRKKDAKSYRRNCLDAGTPYAVLRCRVRGRVKTGTAPISWTKQARAETWRERKLVAVVK